LHDQGDGATPVYTSMVDAPGDKPMRPRAKTRRSAL
jgi:hypothetical protein